MDDGVKMTVEAYQRSGFQRGIDWVYDAQCDYLVKKWCQKNEIGSNFIHLGFVNYLGTASLKNKMLYYSIYFQDYALIKLAKKVRKLF